MRFEERTEGVFELMALASMFWKTAANRDDGAYATRDLFTKHPQIKDAYKYVGRHDDTLVLSNGEKVNPIAFEGRVRQHHLVAEAVMFGSGKSEPGLVLVLADATKDMSHDQILDQVWPTIEKGQADLPDHARIVRSMVITLPSGTQYPRTDKGTVIRQQFYRKFNQEVENAYLESEDGQLNLDGDELYDFVRGEVQKVLSIEQGGELHDETNPFDMGVNSLQSTQLCRTFQRQLNLRGKKLPLNVVYENPTIRQICRLLSNIMKGHMEEQRDPGHEFSSLLETYGDFENHPSSEGQHFVVLTGATGSLGAHLLAQMVRDSSVTRIYCLVRASSIESALTRVHESLQRRKLYQGLDEAQKAKIVAFPSDLTAARLGLDFGTYRQICAQATAVIHTAWAVNFHMSLSSFQGDIIGTKSLIDLCLYSQRVSPPTFSFCSSISTSMDVSPDSCIEESVPADVAPTVDMGYAQSKLVAENLCILAAEQTGLKTYVMRIGQIVGDTEHGIWNTNEAVPLMIQTAHTIGMLPTVETTHRWLPVDIVATAILEPALRAEAPAGSVLNIVNPNEFRWKSDLLPKLHAAGLDFKEVSVTEWLQTLHESDQDGKVNPPMKLLSHFGSIYGEGRSEERGDNHVWETANAATYSQTFSQGWQLSQDVVTKIITYFCESGWSAENGVPRSRQSSRGSDKTLDGPEQLSSKGRGEGDSNEVEKSQMRKQMEPASVIRPDTKLELAEPGNDDHSAKSGSPVLSPKDDGVLNSSKGHSAIGS